MKRCYGLFLVVLLAAMGSTAIAQESHMPDGMGGRMRFTSTPPLSATVGVKYVYRAVAVSGDSTAVIRYSARVSFKGFAIDSATGVVSWTPDARGWYSISVFATSNRGERISQDFIVAVSGGNGIVQGTVTDTLNTPIAQVVVEVMSMQMVTMGPSMGSYRATFLYTGVTDKYGKYRINHIEPGQYKVHAISPSPNFLSQWWDGGTSPTDPLTKTVTVIDSPSVTPAIDFKLRGGLPQLKTVTVKGFVYDTLGKPVKSAAPQVVFVRAAFALNATTSTDDYRMMFDNDDEDDFRLDGSSACVFQTKADSLGAYKLALPVGTYIAYATAAGYVTEFFLHQSDIRSATTINLQKDSTGISFRLAPVPPVALGKISGSVIDSAKGTGVRSRIVVIRDSWTVRDPYNVARSYTFDTDTLGAYVASGLIPGSYMVMAIPVGSYAPAYYTSDTATTRWKKATRISINGNSVTGVNIFVRALDRSARGYASINGNVRSGSQGAVSGAMVYAFFKSNIAGFALVDNSGNYQISGVAPNTYTISVDMPGYEETSSQTANVTYLSNGAPTPSSVDFSIASVVTAVESPSPVLPADFALSQNFPNPFNPSTAISYQLSAVSSVTLKVFDLLGREVATLIEGQQNAGSYRVTFDASRFASGVYFYQLQVFDVSGSAKRVFAETRKMVLLK